MPRRTRSIKGEIVDFDLMEIKSKMSQQPKPVAVTRREDVIDRRLRRRQARLAEMTAKENVESTKKIVSAPVTEPPITKSKLEEKIIPTTRKIKRKPVGEEI